ncbi:hypothetical protein LTR17_014482 [Elasticomyces elasticus]|nr:hypothetical protein LTR17_014482 [Elasticomyces elasticus]
MRYVAAETVDAGVLYAGAAAEAFRLVKAMEHLHHSGQTVLAGLRRDDLKQKILAHRTDSFRDHGLKERIAQLSQEGLAQVLK